MADRKVVGTSRKCEVCGGWTDLDSSTWPGNCAHCGVTLPSRVRLGNDTNRYAPKAVRKAKA